MKHRLAMFGFALVIATSVTKAHATKIHRLYQSVGSNFGGSPAGKLVLAGPGGSDAIYVLLDDGSGMLLVRTDLDGNVVWSNRYGGVTDNPSEVQNTLDGNLLVAFDGGEARLAKINATTGAVMWAKSYVGMRDVKTITRRGSRYVVMGEASYIATGGDALMKPVAMSVSGVDGSVTWSKIYYEGSAYKDLFHHELEGYALTPGEVVYAGRWHAHDDLHDDGNRRITMLRINANTGLAQINSMSTYILELAAGDYAMESDSPFPVDITRLHNPVSGVYEGFAISGSYSHSATYMYTATDPYVLRVEADSVPRWAMLYGSPHSSKGFARGLRQNAYFFGDRIDVFSSWDQYSAPDANGTVDGFMRINQIDGTAYGITVYDPPDHGFAGDSMNVDGDGGYLGLGKRDTAPYDEFQLLKVGQIGGGISCMADHLLQPEVLAVEHEVIEIIPEDRNITVNDYVLGSVPLPLTVTECDPSMAMSISGGASMCSS